MSDVYEIKAVTAEPKEWEGQYGPMLTYVMDIEADGQMNSNVEINRKPESRAPAVGEKIAGHIEHGNYADKFKLDFEATKELGQPSGRGSSGSKKDWTPESQRDPERSARILRQHSQGIAVQVWENAGDPISIGWRELHPDFVKLCDLLDQDVIQAAKQGADKSEGATPPVSPSPASRPDDTQQWLTKLLEDAALNPDAARALASFVATRFKPDQIKKAEKGLQDQQTLPETVEKLEQAFRLTMGETLPAYDPVSDSLPF